MTQSEQQYFPHYSRIKMEQKTKIKKLAKIKKLSSEAAALRMMIDEYELPRVSGRDKQV